MSPPKQYRADIELTRIAAATSIVIYHSGIDGSKFFYFGLILFATISTFYSGRSINTLCSIKRRFARLAPPYILGVCIYGCVNIATKTPIIIAGKDPISSLLVSPSIHLWYIPFVFVALIAIDISKRVVTGPIFPVITGVSSCILLLSAPCWREPSLAIGAPWAQYIHVSAALLFGAFLSENQQLNRATRNTIIVANILCASVYTLYKSCGLEYIIAYSIIPFITVTTPFKTTNAKSRLFALAQCSLGVYIIHPLIMFYLIKRVITVENIILPLASFAASLLLVYLMHILRPSITATALRYSGGGGMCQGK